MSDRKRFFADLDCDNEEDERVKRVSSPIRFTKRYVRTVTSIDSFIDDSEEEEDADDERDHIVHLLDTLARRIKKIEKLLGDMNKSQKKKKVLVEDE